MSAETEKYEQAWKKFQNKIDSLKRRKLELLKNISKKFDEQKIKTLREKLK
ncbi:MAG: hypothetical protein Q8L10_03555 [Candidatus Moranbacteria bacterium]|nr:hypothetical protein [Candidatus Moranbacteria bacterium]